MGEVSTEKKRSGKAKPAAKKLSTRVDMTPVVDLAFLLLTFFMLATTFIKPQIMELILPEKNTEDMSQPKVNEKRVLNIVLTGEDKIFWFVGLTAPQVNETDYTPTGIRTVMQEQNALLDDMIILIKPDEFSTYENLIDILDEIEITGMTRYALVDYGPEDRSIMAPFTPGAVVETSVEQS
jgi:biopolymer transport protein ExbD